MKNDLQRYSRPGVFNLRPAALRRVLCSSGRLFHKIQCVINVEAWVTVHYMTTAKIIIYSDSNLQYMIKICVCLRPHGQNENFYSDRNHYLSLTLIGAFMWLMPHVPYRATTCWERELSLDHIHTFWPHKDTEGLPRWGISSMPGPPPRQYEHERRYTPFTHQFILTTRIWKDDYDGQIIFEEPWEPKDLWHLSYRWGKTPKKTSPRKLIPTGDRTRARCVTGAYVTACSTAVDKTRI